MAINYAKGLSEYEHKGICGLPEIKDDDQLIENNVKELADLFKQSNRIVVLVGAGISTNQGIPDFRGPNGVWTRELKNEEVNLTSKELNFKDIKPSFTHLALTKLAELNLVQLIISQNVDGLFLKTGLKRSYLAEMHGNFFLDECNQCLRRYIRNEPSPTMGLKLNYQKCFKKDGRPCRGILRDTILDWEDELPAYELNRANELCTKADLVLVLGSSLQIQPVNKMPFLCKKRKLDKGKVAIINLQKTCLDEKIDLVIHDYVDHSIKKLIDYLDIKLDNYSEDRDLILNCKPGTLYE